MFPNSGRNRSKSNICIQSITETAVEIITFARKEGGVVPFAFIETVLEKRSQTEGLYSIKCRNQLGVVSTGTWDKQIQTDSESGKLDFFVKEAMEEKRRGNLPESPLLSQD